MPRQMEFIARLVTGAASSGGYLQEINWSPTAKTTLWCRHVASPQQTVVSLARWIGEQSNPIIRPGGTWSFLRDLSRSSMETAAGGLSRLREPLFNLQDQQPPAFGDLSLLHCIGRVGPAECARRFIRIGSGLSGPKVLDFSPHFEFGRACRQCN